MLRRKLKERQKNDINWPLTPEELSRLGTGPLPEIHNAIYFSVYQSASFNQYRYATTSHINATKICDLLQEKGPTAAKRCFKTQLTTFSL